MRRTVILFVAIAIIMVVSVSSYADEKNSTSVSKSSVQSAQKPRYKLRKKPIIVSENEAPRVFRLGKDEIEKYGKKYPNWRPLEYIRNDFRDNGDGTITDHATGLMWQKSGSAIYLTYENAKAYIEKLKREKFASYGDWRLPTVNELKSLLTQDKQSNDRYINTIFDETQQFCWTSDKRVSGGAWHVYFYRGCVYWHLISDDLYVRAVRSLSP